MVETLKLANSPMMWILSLIIVSTVIVQSVIFYRMAKGYVAETGILTKDEMKAATKIGAVSTIGPAIAIFTVAVVLIAQIGSPVTLSRVGVIGSAAFENLAAGAGSGHTLGTDAFTPAMLSAATWVMTIGGAGWLISTFFLTKKLDQTQASFQKTNPKIIKYIGSFTPFAIFLAFAINESRKGIVAATANYGPAAAVIAGGLAMWGFMKLAKNPKLGWLRDWAMGFAIIVGMIAGSIVG